MLPLQPITGVVKHGLSLGKKLGFPTANIALPADYRGQLGVYFASVTIDEELFFGVLSIGTRPTIKDGLSPNAECYILDFDRDLYGKTITVQPLQYIRSELRFSGVEQLKKQIEDDVVIARKIQYKTQ